jgi:hypothetical protein
MPCPYERPTNERGKPRRMTEPEDLLEDLLGHKKRGGLRRIGDLDETEPCRHPAHNPPTMIVLPPGKYEYTCPGCGHAVTFIVQGFSC